LTTRKPAGPRIMQSPAVGWDNQYTKQNRRKAITQHDTSKKNTTKRNKVAKGTRTPEPHASTQSYPQIACLHACTHARLEEQAKGTISDIGPGSAATLSWRDTQTLGALGNRNYGRTTPHARCEQGIRQSVASGDVGRADVRGRPEAGCQGKEGREGKA